MKKYVVLCSVFSLLYCITCYAQGPDLQITNPNLSAGNYFARDEVHVNPITISSSGAGPIHLYVDPNIILNHDYASSTINPTDAINRPLDNDLVVGTTESSYQVTPYGTLNYSVPLGLPPGSSNMVPHLSLVYSSMGQPGIIGYGWELSGVSSIERTGKSIYHNGVVEGVKFSNENDWFTLEGNRLIPISGLNGDPNTIYKAEIEDYSEIKSFGTEGNGPAYFTVRTKDGITLEFGNSPDSKLIPYNRIVNGSIDLTPLAYMVNRVSDLTGNYILYEYIQLDGEIHISKIKYTGNTNVPFDPYNVVEFHYDTRADIASTNVSDANSTFIEGGTLNSSLILHDITINCEQQFTKKYKFNYSFSGVYSFLVGIEEYGSDFTKYNDLLFSYDEDLIGPEESLTNLNDGFGCGQGYYTKYIPIDFNQDGASDLLALCGQMGGSTLEWQSWNILQNNGSGSFTLKYVTSFNFPPDFISADYYPLNKSAAGNMRFEEIDINNDFKEDLLFITMAPGGGTVKIYPYISQGESGYDGAIPTPFESFGNYVVGGTSVVKFLDFNGNGKTDVFVCHQNGDHEAYFTAIFIDIGSGSQPYQLSHLLDFRSSFPLDIDGDGKTDLCNIKSPIFNIGDQYILRFDGTDFSFIIDPTNFTYPGFLDYSLMPDPNCISGLWFDLFGDFNGDRISDLLEAHESSQGLTWTVKYGIGNYEHLEVDGISRGLTLQNPFNTCDRFYIARDVNVDGKTDVLEFIKNTSTTNLNVFYSTGTTFTAETITLNFTVDQNYDDFNFGDFNGDGSEDMMFYHSYIGSWYSNLLCTSPPEIIYFHKGIRSRYLAEAVNGFNAKTEFEYLPLSHGNTFYTQTQVSLSEQVNNYKGAFYVISKLKEPNGVGGVSETNYFYEDAVFHKRGKGFLGFLKIITEKPWCDSKTEISSSFDSDFFCMTPAQTVSSNLVSGLPISEKNFTYLKLPTVGSFGFKVLLDVESTLDKIATNSMIKSYIYDGLGNIENAITNIGNSIEIIEVNSDYTQQIPSLCESITTEISRGGQSFSKTVSYTYNQQGQVLSEISFPGMDGSVAINYSYLNGGVIDSKTISAPNFTPAIPERVWSYVYDKYLRFVKVGTNPLGQTSEIRYDAKWGKPLWQKGADGLITTYNYDGFGRNIKSVPPDGRSRTINYELVESGDMPTRDPLGINGFAVYSETAHTEGYLPSKSYFDIFGRELETQSTGLNGAEMYSQKKYNAFGGISQKTGIYLATGGLDLLTTSYFYHEDHERPNVLWKIEITDGNSSNSSEIDYTYPADGSMKIKSTSSDGKWIEKTTDPSGKLISVNEFGSGLLSYSYLPTGKVSEISVNGSVASIITYDPVGHQHFLTEKNIGTIEFDYDAFNQLVSTTDQKGNHYELHYDVIGRIMEKIGDEETYSYNYVQLGNGLNQIQQELVNYTTGATYTSHYTYDALGRNTSYSRNVDGEMFSTVFHYNFLGELSKTIYPGGFVTSNLYDNGLLSEINMQGNVIWKADEMNSLGHINKYTLGNSIQTELGYNSFGICEDIVSGNIQNLHLDFDPANGNLTSRTDLNKNLSEIFEYDELNRLTTVTGPTTLSIGYNSDGTIQFKDDIGNYTDYSDVHLDALGEITNPVTPGISEISQSLNYTRFNKAATISENENELTVSYGPNQQRIKSQLLHQGTPVYTRYFHPNFEKIIQGGHTYEINYILSSSGLVAMYVTTDGSNGQFYYIYKDHLGSILKVTDVNGSAIEQSFDAWGRYRDPDTWAILNSPPSLPAWLSRGFTSHEQLPEFSLVNMNGRLYDPQVGTMLSPDKFVQDASKSTNFNRYAYCLNNPVSFVDPSGNKWWHWLLGEILTGGMVSTTAVTSVTTLSPFLTDQGYESQKYVSPVAVKLNFHYGSMQKGIGFDVSIGMLKGNPGYRYNRGYTYYSSNYGGYTGWEKREGGEIEILPSITYSGTKYTSGQFTQTTNMWTFGSPINNLKTENDMNMFDNRKIPGIPMSDNGDRYRTGAGQINVGLVSIGMNVFTGDPGLTKSDKRPDGDNNYGVSAYGSDPDDPRYRAGILYVGIGPIKIGINSERIRAAVQNGIHDNPAIDSPHFRELDIPDSPYFYIGSGTGNSLY